LNRNIETTENENNKPAVVFKARKILKSDSVSVSVSDSVSVANSLFTCLKALRYCPKLFTH